MLTQTLQDIIGKEPFHWRGDRDGLEEFNRRFLTLAGRRRRCSTRSEMQEFEDFLATIHFPPNPFRNLDNSLSTTCRCRDTTAPDASAPPGTPLPNGNAQHGLALYRSRRVMFQGLRVRYLPHAARRHGHEPKMIGTTILGDIPPGPHGEQHHGLMAGRHAGPEGPPSAQSPRENGLRCDAVQLAGRLRLHARRRIDSLARFVELRRST